MIGLPELLIVAGVAALVGTYLSFIHRWLSSSEQESATRQLAQPPGLRRPDLARA